METETRLWTDKYTDEKYGEEQGSSFKYFQEFIKMDTPRDLVSFHKHISKILSKKGRTRLPSYQTIGEYSAKWKWFKRAEAYDKWKRNVDDEKDKEEQRRIRRKAIAQCEDSFDLSHQLDMELKNNSEMNTNQKIYGFAKNKEGFKNTAQAFNELINEGATVLDATLDADVKEEIQSENKTTTTIYDMVDNQLEIENVTGEEGHSNNKEG